MVRFKVMLAAGSAGLVPFAASQAAAAPAIIAGAEGKSFDGVYLALDIGRQDMVGGALINGVDMLAQRQRFAGNFGVGYRKQFGRFVLGAEGGFGVVDGSLSSVDNARQLTIDAHNNIQSFYGAQAGFLLDKKKDLLLYGYLSEVSRSYDLSIVSMGASFRQVDKQGMLRFGGGLEKRISGPAHLRVSAGTARGKYGAAVEKPERHLEFMAGVVLQF